MAYHQRDPPPPPSEYTRPAKRGRRQSYGPDSEQQYLQLFGTLPQSSRQKLNFAIQRGEIGEREIDISVLDSLSQFMPRTVDEIVDVFVRGDNNGGLPSVRNKSAY